jgi:hypothetical protein
MNMTFKNTVIAGVIAMVSSASFAYGEPPTGWTAIVGASTSNVKFYQKNDTIYAQVVDMGAGAKVELKQTKVGTMTNTNGTFNTYGRYAIDTWYAGAGNPVSVINGDFFDQFKTPTPISFAIRANGLFVEPGADPNGNKRQIEFITGTGAIVTTANTWRMTGGAIAQNAMGGHAPTNTPTPTYARGRTTLCTLSPSSPSRLFLIIMHLSATKTQVDSDLANWKCNVGSEIVMDGSASSQLVYKEGGVLKNVMVLQMVVALVALYPK